MSDPFFDIVTQVEGQQRPNQDPFFDIVGGMERVKGDPFFQVARQVEDQEAPQPDEESSLVGSAARTALRPILAGLGYLQRPSSALWTGVSNLTDEDPETGFFGGAWKGLKGQSHTQLSDVLGMPKTSAQDTWPVYLGKLGAQFIVDMAGDPLTYFGPGVVRAAGKGIKGLAGALGYADEIAKLGKVPAKIDKAIAGSTIGKIAYHDAPVGEEAFDVMKQQLATESNIVLEQLTEKYNAARSAIGKYSEQIGDGGKTVNLTDDLIREGIEHPDSEAAKLIPKDISDPILALKDMASKKFDEEDAWREVFRVVRREKTPETDLSRWLPRIETGEGKLLREASSLPEMGAGKPSQPHSRTLQRWVESMPYAGGKGSLIDPLNEGVIITEKMSPQSLAQAGIQVLDDGAFSYKGRLVEPVMPSLMDIYKTGDEKLTKRFLTNTELSLASDISAKQSRITFYKFLGWVSNNAEGTKNWAQDVVYQAGKKLVRDPETGSLIPLADSSFRELGVNLPGMQKKVFQKWTANQLENMYQLHVDPDAATDVLTKFTKAFFNTQFGQYMKAYTQVWKRNQLALFPGFHAANAISNQMLIYLAGARDPRLIKEAMEVLFAGKGGSVISGLSNAEVKQLLRRTGSYQTGMAEAGIEGGDDLLAQLGKATKFRFTEKMSGGLQKMGVPEKIADYPADIAKNWEWLNDKGFWVGQQIENHGKTVIALDYIKKAVKAGRAPTQELFNEAAMRAKRFMFDYGLLTPFEQQLKNVFPFLSWYRNIFGLALKQLGSATGISRMDKIGRFWDFSFTPLSNEDQRIKPDYITGAAKGAPIIDAIRAGLGYPNKGDEIMETSRFNALGSIQQFIDRPSDALLANLGPIPRALIEGATGKSYFLNRPIDREAGGMGRGLINPLMGKPYEVSYHKTLGFNAPAALDYILSSYTPLSRHMGTQEALMGNVLYDDPSRKPMSGPARLMWLLTGGKAQDFDKARWQKRTAGEYQDELNYLRRTLRDAGAKGDIRRLKHYQKQLEEKARHNPFAGE